MCSARCGASQRKFFFIVTGAVHFFFIVVSRLILVPLTRFPRNSQMKVASEFLDFIFVRKSNQHPVGSDYGLASTRKVETTVKVRLWVLEVELFVGDVARCLSGIVLKAVGKLQVLKWLLHK